MISLILAAFGSAVSAVKRSYATSATEEEEIS